MVDVAERLLLAKAALWDLKTTSTQVPSAQSTSPSMQAMMGTA
jgi:hypothetical protein